jgi:hypothetical protein
MSKEPALSKPGRIEGPNVQETIEILVYPHCHHHSFAGIFGAIPSGCITDLQKN